MALSWEREARIYAWASGGSHAPFLLPPQTTRVTLCKSLGIWLLSIRDIGRI